MVEKAEMTPLERVMGALNMKETDRVPLVPMCTLPGIRYAGYKVDECLADADKFVQAQMKLLDDFGFDAVWVQAGIDDLTVAMGATVKLSEDSYPAMRDYPVKSHEDLERMRSIEAMAQESVQQCLHRVRQLKKAVGKDMPVFATMKAPFNTACMWSGVENIYKSMITDPAFVTEIADFAAQKVVGHAVALAEAGADVVWIGNSVASALSISRKHYEWFAHPSSTAAFQQIKESGVKAAIHTCGDWNDRFDLVFNEDVDIWHVSAYSELSTLKKSYGHRVCLMGNVPAVQFLNGSPEEIRDETKKCIQDAGRGGGLLLSSDCIIPWNTPPENLQAILDAGREYGSYPLSLESSD